MRAEERDYFDREYLDIDTPSSRRFTVGELRTALDQYPPETVVGVFGFDGGGDQVDLIFNAENKRLAIVGDES